LREGFQLNLPLWAAEKVWEEGLGEPVGGPIDLSRIMQLAWRERRSPVELVELPDKFYYLVSSMLVGLQGRDPAGYKTIVENLRDLVSLRIDKLLGFAARGVDPSLIKNMTEEEKQLYLRIKESVDSWIESLGLGVR